jgi:hypothetical protein
VDEIFIRMINEIYSLLMIYLFIYLFLSFKKQVWFPKPCEASNLCGLEQTLKAWGDGNWHVISKLSKPNLNQCSIVMETLHVEFYNDVHFM